MYAISPLTRGFHGVKNFIPGMYPADVEIRQETVSSSEVYRTIDTGFMMLKCTCTVLNIRRYVTFAEYA